MLPTSLRGSSRPHVYQAERTNNRCQEKNATEPNIGKSSLRLNLFHRMSKKTVFTNRKYRLENKRSVDQFLLDQKLKSARLTRLDFESRALRKCI